VRRLIGEKKVAGRLREVGGATVQMGLVKVLQFT
jgi:hypothetical protein